MKRKLSSGKITPFLFSMVLLLLFVLCAVFTVLIGSQVYQNIRMRNQNAFYSDTALSFITNKVRQSDRSGCICIETRDSQEVLVLSCPIEDLQYETLLYARNGSLYELFTEVGSGLSLDAGTPVMDCAGISFSLSESSPEPLLTITLTEMDGSERSAQLALRSKQTSEGYGGGN